VQAGPQVLLTWSDNANNELNFVVERADNGGAFAVIATLAANAVSYTDTGVLPGGGYDYRVMATNAVGNSAYSNTASAVVPTGPAAPTNLVATLQTPTQVGLTWIDNATDETGFQIERATVTGGVTGPFAVIATLGVNVSAYSDATVAPNTTYAYRVFASNAVGSSLPSNVAQITTPPVQPLIPAPTNLVAMLLGNPLRIRLTFRDNAINETGFQVERSVDGGAFSLLATLPPRANRGNVTYVDAAVLVGHTYAYQVRAMNGVPSAYSNQVSVSVMVPAAPSNFVVAAVASGNSAIVTLNWTDNSNNETRFVIQRASDPNFTVNVGSNNVAANTTTVQQTRNRNRDIYYRIQAVNTITGASAWMNAVPFPIHTP
jgi:hypothetical protein